MAECLHESFESLVSVHLVESSGMPPYHQARLQVRCTQCQGPLLFTGLPPVNAMIFQTVAAGAGGSELYASGTVTPPTPAQEGQTWTRVVMPAPAVVPEATAGA